MHWLSGTIPAPKVGVWRSPIHTPEFWRELAPVVEEQLVPAGIRLVTDHFALLKGASMLAQESNDENVTWQQPGFKEVLDLVRAGHLYVKT